MDNIEDNKLDEKKKLLTFFLLFFPSILLILIPTVINGSFALAFGIKICVLFYQFVALKNFIDLHYE